jgi:hypothetical protein
MPWQRYVADVALEIDPKTGRLAYREVVLTVPRQSGKTTLLLALMVQRALGFQTRQRILYTAQTRGAARLKWEEEHVNALKASTFKNDFTVRLQLGHEAIKWNNGSRHGVVPSTATAGHGETLDLGVIDEAFAQVDNRLEQAFKPAMITRPQPQLWIVSTAGTKKSVYLRAKVDAGRERCAADVRHSVAYFEWSAPDDADPNDEEIWWSCMPALGHTINPAAIRADKESMDLADFRRAYLNQWPDAAPDRWTAMPEQMWRDAIREEGILTGRVAFGLDATPNGSHGAIGTWGKNQFGQDQLELTDHSAGTGWMVERALQLAVKWQPKSFVIDAKGPIGSKINDLKKGIDKLVKSGLLDRNIPVVTPNIGEICHACGWFYDSVRYSRMVHLGDKSMAYALAGADKRMIGDSWAWSRKSTDEDISPLYAGTLAAHGFNLPEDEVEPWASWE